MIAGMSILTSLMTGGLLSLFPHFYVLLPATALIAMALVAKGLLEHNLLLAALSAITLLTALQLGFFLGLMLRSLIRPAKRPARALAYATEAMAQSSASAISTSLASQVPGSERRR
jgi:hypothetical protein